MNHVFALRGRAKTLHVGSEHGLTSDDGELLVRLLREMRVSVQRARERSLHGPGFAGTAMAGTPSL
jgi:hypothetical protein